MSVPQDSIYFGGIEGGASKSTAIVCNGAGRKVAEVVGLGTNHWAIGMAECQNRIYALITECKKQANIPDKQMLQSLCLSLSGCEQEETNDELKNGLMKKYPNLSKSICVYSDTISPIATVRDSGGVVVIAGTGSNALLVNPDGSVYQSGGWGHILGDEGSGFWISLKAIKIYYDDQDGFQQPPNGYPTDVVWSIIQGYFNIKTRFDILPHIYKNFEKSKVAGLCARIAEGADMGDPLCQWIFSEAGRCIARFILALAPKCLANLFDDKAGGLAVVCVGSVWKSWRYMEPGFTDEMKTNTKKFVMEELSLYRLSSSAAIGAVYLAARLVKFEFPFDYSSNSRVFYHYVR